MRVPRVRRVDVTIPRLGAGLDGVTVVLLTDTHYGPIDRARWSTRVVDAVNALDADIVCHTGSTDNSRRRPGFVPAPDAAVSVADNASSLRITAEPGRSVW